MNAPDRQIVVGRRAVTEALAERPGEIAELMVMAGDRSPALKRLKEAARAAGVKTVTLDRAELDALAQGAGHQGVAVILAGPSYTPFEAVLSAAKEAGPMGLVVVADHVQDPHNLGAMVRSAAAAGAQGLVIPKDRACPLTPAVAKAAAGGLARLPVSRVTNLTNALDELKRAGLWALAAATRGEPAPWDLDLTLPVALVVGGEHKGVGQRLLAACDLRTSLPLAPGAESLNASVACGVLLFELVRQRSPEGQAS